jgi:serine/threonine protein kinase
MALAAGDRLGRYEIVAPLGKGGMGEVYRARDSTLERDRESHRSPSTQVQPWRFVVDRLSFNLTRGACFRKRRVVRRRLHAFV